MLASQSVAEGMIRRLFADGVVVQAGSQFVRERDRFEAASASFVPFDETKLDF